MGDSGAGLLTERPGRGMIHHAMTRYGIHRRPVRPTRYGAGRWRFACIGLILGLALLLSSCTSALTLLPAATATPLPAATVTPATHDLAILGVEFDPPLDLAQILSRGSIRLVVAIENRGLSPQFDVRVTARLVDPGDGSDPRVLFDEEVSVRRLEAGELRTVGFPQVSDLPRLDVYHLEVHVEPVPGEADTADNTRAFEILLR